MTHQKSYTTSDVHPICPATAEHLLWCMSQKTLEDGGI